MIKLPPSWTTWGDFPKSTDKDLYTFNVLWRAFSPDHQFMIEVKWRPEQDPKGTMICNLEVDQDYRNKQYETRPANVKELVRDIETIMGKLPEPGIMVEASRGRTENNSKRTSVLEASTVTTTTTMETGRKKRKYTKRSARWTKK